MLRQVNNIIFTQHSHGINSFTLKVEQKPNDHTSPSGPAEQGPRPQPRNEWAYLWIRYYQ